MWRAGTGEIWGAVVFNVSDTLYLPSPPQGGEGNEALAERSSAISEVGEGKSLRVDPASTPAQSGTAGPSPTATKRCRAKSRSPLPVGEGKVRLIPSLSILETGCAFRFALHEAGLWRALDAVGDDISLAELAEALQIPPGDITEDPKHRFLRDFQQSYRPAPVSEVRQKPSPDGRGWAAHRD